MNSPGYRVFNSTHCIHEQPWRTRNGMFEATLGCAARLFLYDHNGRAGARQRAESRPRDELRQPSNIPVTFIPCRHLHTNFVACVSQNFLPGRCTDTNTVGAQSRRDTAAPGHPTHPRSTGPATARPGTACLPWRPCTALHSRGSTGPIAGNRHSKHTVRRHTRALANDGHIDTQKHAAMGSGARQHAGHAGHQPRAAHTKNPSPPARWRQICLPRSLTLRLLGRHGEVGDCSRAWHPG